MKQALLFVLGLMLIVGCREEAETPPAEKSISENLPIADRDLLLAPLESALDDLREVILRDESYFASSYSMQSQDITGEVRYKLDGPDTVMVVAGVRGRSGSEYHEAFSDEGGSVFFTHHRFEDRATGAEAIPSQREYKFYYEDNGLPLSVYARMAFGKDTVAGTWTPVCLTAGEEHFIKGRLKHIRGLGHE